MDMRRPVRKTAILMAPLALISVGLAANGPMRKETPDESGATPAASANAVPEEASAAPRYVEPLADLERISQAFHSKPDPNEEKRLDSLERDLRQSVASGWRPPWSGLEIKMTDEQIASLPTEALAKACFASGLPARTSLLYDNPNASFRRLEVLYRGFGELFSRDDAWKIPIGVIDLYAADLDSHDQTGSNVNAIMGLTTLPELYGYPKVRKQIAGHEKEIIAAHIRSLERISVYLASMPASHQDDAPAPFFSVTAPVVLVRWALVLGRDVSAEQYDAAHAALSQYKWLQDESPQHAKPLVDRAIEELKPFVK